MLNIKIILIVFFVLLPVILNNANEIISSNNLKLNLGSQDLDPDSDNPSTGGINGKMLKDLGCDYVLIGHSERRSLFSEDEEVLLKKLTSAVKHELKVIYCVGETKEQKEIGDWQLKLSRFN